MDLEEFRSSGHALIDWITQYLAEPKRYPVLAQVSPGQIAGQIPHAPPLRGEPMEAILADFEQTLLPGITHWNHPGFFAYFSISGSGPGILGELLTAALNVNGMLWKTSPTATELEEVTLDWLRQMLGLPGLFRGVITDTASVSTLLAIAAARQAVPGLNVREEGLSGRPDRPVLRLYTSDQAHSSVEKAAITLGIGQNNVVKIPSDAEFRLRADTLEQTMWQDRQKGLLPFCVVATVGTTSTTSIDPISSIASLCRSQGVWLHVDGAYGGAIAVAPELRPQLAGWEAADSIVVNPHKWLFTPIDCSALYVRSSETLKQAFQLVPEYLVTDGDATNYMDWGVQLGRRFRALKLWMVIRHFGQEGLADRIRDHCRLAQLFAGWVDASTRFERTAPTPMSLVCFRAHPKGLDDESALESLNTQLLQKVNASGEIYLSHTRLHGRYTLRLAIGNIRTAEPHVARAWELLNEELPLSEAAS